MLTYWILNETEGRTNANTNNRRFQYIFFAFFLVVFFQFEFWLRYFPTNLCTNMEVKHEFPNAETFYLFIEAKHSRKSFFSIFFVLLFFSSFVGFLFSFACQAFENVHLGCAHLIVVCRVLYIVLSFRFGTGFLIKSMYFFFDSFQFFVVVVINTSIKRKLKMWTCFLVLFVYVPILLLLLAQCAFSTVSE